MPKKRSSPESLESRVSQRQLRGVQRKGGGTRLFLTDTRD